MVYYFIKLINAKDKIGNYGNLHNMLEYSRIDTSSYTKMILIIMICLIYIDIFVFSKLFNYNINITDISVNLQFDFNKKICYYVFIK